MARRETRDGRDGASGETHRHVHRQRGAEVEADDLLRALLVDARAARRVRPRFGDDQVGHVAREVVVVGEDLPDLVDAGAHDDARCDASAIDARGRDVDHHLLGELREAELLLLLRPDGGVPPPRRGGSGGRRRADGGAR